MPRRKQPRIPDAILDQLLAGADPKTAFDPNGLLDDLKKALAKRALNAEMDYHLARRRDRQRPQRLWSQVGDHRHRQARPTDPARSPSQLRSPADCQVSAPLPRLR